MEEECKSRIQITVNSVSLAPMRLSYILYYQIVDIYIYIYIYGEEMPYVSVVTLCEYVGPEKGCTGIEWS